MLHNLIDVEMSDRTKEAIASLGSASLQIRAQAEDEGVDVRVYGVVGDELDENSITAAKLADVLSANRGKKVTVRINSPGGLAWDGVTIYNALLKHDGPVETVVEGLAGSAATLIAVAGRPAKMFANASFFVHKASGIGIGNSDLMIEMAEFLDKVDNQIARTYAAKTGQAVDLEIKHMSGKGKRDGTVFNAEQAKRAGYIDEIIPLTPAATAMLDDDSDVTIVIPGFVGKVDNLKWSNWSNDQDEAARDARKTAMQADVAARLGAIRKYEVEQRLAAIAANEEISS